jgi:hypothetical protein
MDFVHHLIRREHSFSLAHDIDSITEMQPGDSRSFDLFDESVERQRVERSLA